jgi:acetyl esterase/lipase
MANHSAPAPVGILNVAAAACTHRSECARKSCVHQLMVTHSLRCDYTSTHVSFPKHSLFFLIHDVLFAALWCMLGRITIAQSRYLNKSTGEEYVVYCKRLKVESKTVEIRVKDDKVAAHWLGSPKAKSVILYFHGGAYTQLADMCTFQCLARLLKKINGEKDAVAFLMLAYTLAPEGVNPTQLRQAAAALTHLIDETDRSPANIFVSGDSAGGNLGLSLLSHILHPHPDVQYVKLDAPLGGALRYSPWTGFNSTYPSFENGELDMMSPLPCASGRPCSST